MNKSEPRYFEGWDGPLLPYAAFHEHYTKGQEWWARQEYVIPTDLHERITITIERADNWTMYDLGRADTLAENGIWDLELDTKDLADRLMETLFYHMSDFQLMHIMNKMAERCNINQDFTKDLYATFAPTQPLPQCGGEQENERQEGL